MFTAACLRNSSPEAPDNITILQTTITLDGDQVAFCDDYFSLGLANIVSSGDGPRHLALSGSPVDPGALVLYRNGVAQRRDTAYFLFDTNIVLKDVALDGDVFQAHYMGYKNPVALNPQAGPTGYLMALSTAATSLPGYLLCDGATSHNKLDFPVLWAYLSLHPDLVLTSDTNTFTLKLLSIVVQSTPTLVTVSTFIKT